uniref:Uncharacterized protein n=1 Tax=Oncorhynchus tshawytscha TaxID=74940 RepID=A0A8C8FSS1_ONCTS
IIFLMYLQMMLRDVIYFILRGSVRILVLITGSGGALGCLFALEFTKHGAEVVLWDVDANDNEETVRLVREAGVCTCLSMFVLACMCVYLSVRAFGPAYMCVSQMTKAFIPQMKEQNHGHIITVASVPGLFSTTCDYCASKFAAVSFHESLAHKLLTEEFDGVKTTLVCPHIVDTGHVVLFLAPLEPEYCVEQAMNAILIDQPLHPTPHLPARHLPSVSTHID